MENSGTRSTRVVFHNNIVCDVFNVNSSSHQKCRDNITSYTEEEFVPSGVPSIDHLTFQIQRNEAVPDVIPSRLLPIPSSHTTPTQIQEQPISYYTIPTHFEGIRTDQARLYYNAGTERTLWDYQRAQKNPRNYASFEEQGNYENLNAYEDDDFFGALDDRINEVQLDADGRLRRPNRTLINTDAIDSALSIEVDANTRRPLTRFTDGEIEYLDIMSNRTSRSRVPNVDIGMELADLAGTAGAHINTTPHVVGSTPPAPPPAPSTALTTTTRTNPVLETISDLGGRAYSEFRLVANRKNAMDLTAMSVAGGIGMVGGYYTAKALSENDWFQSLLMSDDRTWSGAANVYGGTALMGLTAGGVMGGLASLTQTAGMATQRAMLWAMTSKGLAQTAEQITAKAFLKAAGTSFLKGLAEGAFVGMLLSPLDMYLQKLFLRNGMNHTQAGSASGAIVGGAGVAINAGLMYAGLVTAPETFGLSIAMAVGAIAISTIAGAVFGHFQDEDNRKYTNNYNWHRNILVENLPRFDYDVDKTIAALEAEDPTRFYGDWYKDGTEEFVFMLRETFNERPYRHREQGEVSADDLKTNGLMQRHIADALRYKGTQSGHPEFNSIEVNELNDEEIKWLDEHTNKTWRQNAELQANIQYQAMMNDAKKTDDAQKAVLLYWNTNHTFTGLDPRIMSRATSNDATINQTGQGVTFQSFLDTNVSLDAQNRILEAFQTSGLRYDQMDAELRRYAEKDPAFRQIATDYQTSMMRTADEMNITLPQLITLQQTPVAQQERLYRNYQFDTLKANNQVVGEIINLNTQIDFANQTGQGFYDLDQYRLDYGDSEYRSNWNPAEAQIYLAHQANMTLQQYNDYLHQLGKGNRGDFNNLPEYTPNQLRQQREADIAHFYAELEMTGHGGEYTYNPETNAFDVNTNNANYGDAPQNRRALRSSAPLYADPFMPQALQQSNQDFTDMAHGLNQSNANKVDAYNAQLETDIATYDAEHRRLVADYNSYNNIRGLDGGMYFDAQAEYDRLRAVYNPISENIYDYDNTIDITTPPRDRWREARDNINKTLNQPTAEHYANVKTYGKRGMDDEEIAYALANIRPEDIQAYRDKYPEMLIERIMYAVVGDWSANYQGLIYNERERVQREEEDAFQAIIDNYNEDAHQLIEYEEDAHGIHIPDELTDAEKQNLIDTHEWSLQKAREREEADRARQERINAYLAEQEGRPYVPPPPAPIPPNPTPHNPTPPNPTPRPTPTPTENELYIPEGLSDVERQNLIDTHAWSVQKEAERQAAQAEKQARIDAYLASQNQQATPA